MIQNFRGIFPALTTPFVNGKFSKEKFSGNISKFKKFDYSGYLVLGSTGESILLTDGEKLSIVESACALIPSGKKVIVGAGRDTAEATVEFIEKISDFDPDAALVVTPFYYKSQMTTKVMINYFTQVADKSGIPVLIYNVPKFTGISIQIEAVKELMEHPNIAGIKESSGSLEFIEEIIRIRKPGFSVFTGAGSIICPSLMMGANGAVVAVGNIDLGTTVEMYNAYKYGDINRAKDIQFNLIEVNKKIAGAFGIPGIKHALDLLGFYGGDPRPPLLPLENSNKEKIKTILLEAGLLKE